MITNHHITVLSLLRSKGFPEPTARILAGWSPFNKNVKLAQLLLDDLIAEGLCSTYVQDKNVNHARKGEIRHKITESGIQVLKGRLF